MLGQYNKIEAVTYADGRSSYILTGWNIPLEPDFEIDLCENCHFASELNRPEVSESYFVCLVETIDDILRFADEHDISDRLQLDCLQQLIVGKNQNHAVSFLLNLHGNSAI